MAEIFDFQDRIRDEIVAALKLTLTQYVINQGRPMSVKAYTLYLEGRAEYYRYTTEGLEKVKALLAKAIEIEPTLSDAHSYISRCIKVRWVQAWPGHDETLDRTIEIAKKAAYLNPASCLA